MKFLALVALIAWPVGLTAIPIPSDEPVAEISAPSVQNGWARAGRCRESMDAAAQNAAWTHGFSYARSDSDAPVQLVIGGFSRQSWNAKLVTSVHELAPPGGHRCDVTVSPQRSAAHRSKAAQSSFAMEANDSAFGNGTRCMAQFTGANTTAKWLQLKARLAGKPDRGYWIAVAIQG